mmetsp:Transcript_40649/g.107710  ORF Transcript_40649/g.107710 Transcript_40649/m.107710 type:complete len:172 (-) Transcript_40649:69-584(-)
MDVVPPGFSVPVFGSTEWPYVGAVKPLGRSPEEGDGIYSDEGSWLVTCDGGWADVGAQLIQVPASVHTKCDAPWLNLDMEEAVTVFLDFPTPVDATAAQGTWMTEAAGWRKEEHIVGLTLAFPPSEIFEVQSKGPGVVFAKDSLPGRLVIYGFGVLGSSPVQPPAVFLRCP